MDIAPTTLVRTLRVAAQQQVEIAKALTLNAKLLILDEPTAALGGEETERLFAQIDQLRKQGVSFIYISHRLEEIARIADRVAVLRDGRLVATHHTAQVPVNVLLENMVGRSVDRIFPKIEKPAEKEVLRVDGLTSPDGSFTDVSFAVHAGEIFGIAGIVGAGRTELVRAITGADPISSGSIDIDGRPVQIKTPSDSIKAGAGAGARRPQSARCRICLTRLRPTWRSETSIAWRRNGFIAPRKVESFAVDAIKRLGVKGKANQLVRYLSGGNQQKVIIARWISRGPKVFILDEPTRGIDMGARAAIYETITVSGEIRHGGRRRQLGSRGSHGAFASCPCPGPRPQHGNS